LLFGYPLPKFGGIRNYGRNFLQKRPVTGHPGFRAILIPNPAFRAEGTDNISPGTDRHAVIGKSRHIFPGPGLGAVEKMGFLGKIRNGDGYTGFKNPAHKPFPETVYPAAFFFRAESVGFLDFKRSGSPIKERHHAPGKSRPDFQQTEEGPQGVSELYVLIKSTGYIKQKFQFFD
jgi:hypothetical protein